MKHLWATLVLVISFIFPITSFAWWAIGHMVIADIAYQNLTPKVRAKVDKLVVQMSKEYPEINSFMNISYWPDTLRTQKVESFTRWHYVDRAFSDDNTPLKNLIDTDNAIWALNTIQTVIQNEQANPYERARFLAFFVHIVGDVHQPLHTVARISAAHPNGDAGGNLFSVRYKNETVNLHRVWDNAFGEFDGESSPAMVTALAKQITSLYPVTTFGNKVYDLKPENWTNEGYENAKKYVYNTKENDVLTTAYVETGKRVAEQQVALAGYRLAAMLNKLLG